MKSKSSNSININISEKEFEDLISVVYMGLQIAKKERQDQPNFLADAETLYLKLWKLRKRALYLVEKKDET